MKRPRWALILLACLLPLQSVASTLLECHTLEQAGSQAGAHLSHMLESGRPGPAEDCHGERGSVEADAGQLHSVPGSPDDTGMCLHCALDCQSVQSLSLNNAAQQFSALPGHQVTYLSPAVLTEWPNNPQRPPI